MPATWLISLRIANHDDRSERNGFAIDNALREGSIRAAAYGAEGRQFLDIIRHGQQTADITELLAAVIHVKSVHDDMFAAVGKLGDKLHNGAAKKLNLIKGDDVGVLRLGNNLLNDLGRQLTGNGMGRQSVTDPAYDFVLRKAIVFSGFVGHDRFAAELDPFLTTANKLTGFFAEHGSCNNGNTSCLHVAAAPLTYLLATCSKKATITEYHKNLGLGQHYHYFFVLLYGMVGCWSRQLMILESKGDEGYR